MCIQADAGLLGAPMSHARLQAGQAVRVSWPIPRRRWLQGRQGWLLEVTPRGAWRLRVEGLKRAQTIWSYECEAMSSCA